MNKPIKNKDLIFDSFFDGASGIHADIYKDSQAEAKEVKAHILNYQRIVFKIKKCLNLPVNSSLFKNTSNTSNDIKKIIESR